MKHYLLKSNLTDSEQANVNVVVSDIMLFIVEKREYLLSLGILVEVEV